MQVEEVRHGVGGRGPVGEHHVLRAVQLVLVPHHAEVDADLAGLVTGQRVPGVAGVLHGLPSRLQEQPALRIGEGCLLGRHGEEQGVELVGTVDEAAPFAVRLAGLLLRVIMLVLVPAVRRDLLDAVGAAGEHVPELVEITSPGVAPADADDRNVAAAPARPLLLGRGLRGTDPRYRPRRRGCRRRDRCRGRGLCGAQQRPQPLGLLGDEVPGQLLNCAVLEEQRAGNGVEVLTQPPHQLHDLD